MARDVKQPREPINPATAFTSKALDAEMIAMLSMVWKTLYDLPKMAGMGDHWPISDGDAKTLGECSKAALDSLPHKQRKALQDQLNKYVPIATLAGTVATLTYPRVLKSKAALSSQGIRRNGTSIGKPNTPSGGNPAGQADRSSGPVESGVTEADIEYGSPDSIPVRSEDVLQFPK